MTTSPSPEAPARPDGKGGGPLIDFGQGSREQTQGGPSQRRPDNVHPIRKPAHAAPRDRV
ncbi:MAG TPA: hypothetical protein VFW19_07090 [Allosphingosinicella sp.]|nr:hypothetical protein [Allosphingosinicella sp.]